MNNDTNYSSLSTIRIVLGTHSITLSVDVFIAKHHLLCLYNEIPAHSTLPATLDLSLSPQTSSHPYGYNNMQYVSSLISGVGIFCMGAGLSVYHGVSGETLPHDMVEDD